MNNNTLIVTVVRLLHVSVSFQRPKKVPLF